MDNINLSFNIIDKINKMINDYRSNIINFTIAICLGTITFFVAKYFSSRGFSDLAHDGMTFRSAQIVYFGGVPFKDAFSQYGALNEYLNATSLYLFGDRLLSIRLMICLAYSVIIFMQFLLMRFFLPVIGSIICTLLWLTVAPFYSHGLMASAHIYSLVFCLLSYYFFMLQISHHSRSCLFTCGVLLGIAWGFKTNVGMLSLISIIVYYLLQFLQTKKMITLLPIILILIGFFSVVFSIVGYLAFTGAVDDWYKQTILFPSQFYLSYYLTKMQAGTELHRFLFVAGISDEILEKSSLLSFLLYWFFDCFRTDDISPIWFIIRVFPLILLPVLSNLDKINRNLYIFLATTSVFNWFATVPSYNYMHQWWTLTVGFVLFSYCLWSIIQIKKLFLKYVIFSLILVVLFSGDWLERIYSVKFQWQSWSKRVGSYEYTIFSPDVLKGMKTDAYSLAAFSQLTDLIKDYKNKNPEGYVIAMGESGNAILPTTFDQNKHAFKLLWEMPVLATITYPDAQKQLEIILKTEKPLVIYYGDSHLISNFAPKNYHVKKFVSHWDEYTGWTLFEPD